MVSKEEIIEEMDNLKDVLDNKDIDKYSTLLKDAYDCEILYKEVIDGLKTFHSKNSFDTEICNKWICDLKELSFRGIIDGDEKIYFNELIDSKKIVVDRDCLLDVSKDLKGKFIIPSYINEIGSDCFRDCTKITEVFLPQYLKIFGSGNFAGCKSLTKIYVPETVSFNDFWENLTLPVNLKEVHFPKSFEKYKSRLGTAQFRYKILFDN